MLKGETLSVKMSNTFQHNFSNMTISINERVVNVSLGKDKILSKNGQFLTPIVNIGYISQIQNKINQITNILSGYIRNIRNIKRLFTGKN
jgi:hypothetical protein